MRFLLLVLFAFALAGTLLLVGDPREPAAGAVVASREPDRGPAAREDLGGGEGSEPRPLGEADTDGGAVRREALAQPSAGAIPLRVELSVQRGGRGLDGVELEVGVARPRSSWQPGPRGEHILARAVVDAGGRATVELQVPAELLAGAHGPTAMHGGPALVLARIVSPGFQRRATTRPWDGRAGSLELEVTAFPGGTLSGRVERPDGSAAGPGTHVHLAVHDPSRGGLRSRARSDCFDGGRFELHGDLAAPVWLLAVEPEVGSARRRIDPGDLPGEVVLVLEGQGTIGGTLRSPSGTPLALEDLRAVPSSRPRPSSGLDLDSITDAGLEDVRTTTFENGRFLLSGLRPGSYRILATDPDSGRFEQVLAEEVPTGSEDLELVLARRALSIRVLDPAGRQVRPQLLRPRGMDLELAVQGVSLALQALGPQSLALDVRVGPTGTVRVEPREERDLRVTLLSPHHPRQEHLVPAPEPGAEPELVLHLGDPRPAPVLEVEVRGPDGSPHTARQRLRLLDPGGDLVAFSRTREGEASPVRLEAPPGAWRLVVDEPPRRGVHGEVHVATVHLPFEQELHLEPGVRTHVVAVLERGGFLELTCSLPDGWDPPATAPGTTLADLDGAALDRLGAPEVELLPRGRASAAPIRPRFELAGRPGLLRPVSLGAVTVPRLLPGETLRSVDVLPPGEYLLRLEAPGCAVHEEPLTVVAGEVCRRVVQLRR